MVGLQEPEHILGRVQFRWVGWHPQDRHVVRANKILRPVPSGPIKDNQGMVPLGNHACDILQMPVHPTGIGPVTDMPDGLSGCRTQGTEQVTISMTAITGNPGACTLESPNPAEHALLADACLILKPDINLRMERAWGKFPKPQPADHPTDGLQGKGDLEHLVNDVPQP